MEGRARPGSRPLHRPPPPSATFVRRLRAGGAGLVALLVWAVAAPGFLPGDALAVGDRAPGLVGGLTPGAAPSAAEEARLRALAWQRGREAAAAAEGDRAAVREAAAGSGATASPAGLAVPPGGPAIPALTLRAYREAAAWATGFDPGCRLSWTILAGIGRIESNHGLFGGAATRFSAAGTVSPRITGPPLDGNGVASIPDSDGGRWDGDATSRARLRQAIYAYNPPWDYVDAVLGWARVYQGGVATGPAVPAGPSAPSTTATPPTGPAPTDPPGSSPTTPTPRPPPPPTRLPRPPRPPPPRRRPPPGRRPPPPSRASRPPPAPRVGRPP